MSEKNHKNNDRKSKKCERNCRSYQKNYKQKTNFQRKNKNNNDNANNEVVSHIPKERKSMGVKKTIEIKNKDGDADKLKVTKLDDDSTFQEIIDALREFNAFCNENELFKDYEHDGANMSEAQKTKKKKN